MVTMIDNAVGVSIDAPTPWPTRASSSTPNDGASAHSNDATPTIAMPVSSILLRPNRSARAPEVIRNDANTTVYETTTHEYLVRLGV